MRKSVLGILTVSLGSPKVTLVNPITWLARFSRATKDARDGMGTILDASLLLRKMVPLIAMSLLVR